VNDTLTIAKQLGANGVYNLEAGQLNADKVVVGGAGAAVFTQTGGTHIAHSLTLGEQASGYGNYNLFGGVLSVVDETVGAAGIGTFTQAGGAHSVDTLTLAKQSGSTGTYYLRGGNLTVGKNIDSGAGASALLVSGGALNFGTGNHVVNVNTLTISGQGVVNLTDNATTTFQKDVTHNGQAINVEAGSNAIFNASFNGAGPFIGAGTATFNGIFNPGDGPVTFAVAGNMVLGEASKSVLNVDGLSRGDQYDAINVGGALTLNGELKLQFLSGFAQQAGETFDLFDADALSGQFDAVTFIGLDQGLAWKIDYLTDAVGTTDIVRLSLVSSVPLPGSIWLLQSALFGLLAARRVRKAA
jgi:hypothetical protein